MSESLYDLKMIYHVHSLRDDKKIRNNNKLNKIALETVG